MPKIKYALEKGGPKRLEVSYKGNWKDFTIRLDGNVIGTVAGFEELKAGQEFILEDGSILKVKFKFPCLRLFRNGRPLLSYDPAQQLSYVYKIIFFFGVANLALGLSGILLRTNLGNLPPAGLLSISVGCLFLLLGFFVMRRSLIALTIAAGILVLDMVLTIFFPPNFPRFVLIIGVIFRALVLLVMIVGFGAIKALKQGQPQNPVS
ncbi:MAG: hypothetical protein ABII09_12630 [Planctomycetota bacterium]